jgi:hypothetical protein
MTDPLTDAVRRLKELQQDVERLQSAEDEDGEPRLFFTTQEQAIATEAVKLGPDETQSETATASDQQTDLRKQRPIDDGGHYNSTGYVTASYNDP